MQSSTSVAHKWIRLSRLAKNRVLFTLRNCSLPKSYGGWTERKMPSGYIGRHKNSKSDSMKFFGWRRKASLPWVSIQRDGKSEPSALIRDIVSRLELPTRLLSSESRIDSFLMTCLPVGAFARYRQRILLLIPTATIVDQFGQLSTAPSPWGSCVLDCGTTYTGSVELFLKPRVSSISIVSPRCLADIPAMTRILFRLSILERIGHKPGHRRPCSRSCRACWGYISLRSAKHVDSGSSSAGLVAGNHTRRTSRRRFRRDYSVLSQGKRFE